MEVFNPLVEYEIETNSIDPRELKQNEESIEVVEILIVESEGYLIVSLHDISESQHKGTRRLQKLFQSMLTNALSHERMTPLNLILHHSLTLSKR